MNIFKEVLGILGSIFGGISFVILFIILGSGKADSPGIVSGFAALCIVIAIQSGLLLHSLYYKKK